ncbi:hypothetical protein V6Z11_D12G099200 [Gossypium hirsutum]
MQKKNSFSANTDKLVREMLSKEFGFQEVDDLGIYLGMLLFHKRVTKSTFQFIIDKVQKRLNGFDAKLLSMADRITLAKSVFLAIPSYFVQSTMIPVGVCDKIEQIIRSFVWGTTRDAKKVHLVNWDTCCQPMNYGGLGFRKMTPLKSLFSYEGSFSIYDQSGCFLGTLVAIEI